MRGPLWMAASGGPLCVAASVIGMIPCCTSCCCLVGLPVGIWSLMTLMDNDVKAAFR